MNRKLVIGCTVPLVVAGAGVWWSVRAFSGTPTAADRLDTVDRGDVEVKVTETGTMEALKKVEIKSKVAGRISRLLVDEGSRVTAGQLLAEIDPTEINSQVAQIQAQLDGARARLQQVSRGATLQVEQTTASIRQAQEGLKNSEARLLVAQEQSQAQPRLTGSAVAQAESNLKSARESLELLKTSSHPQAQVGAQSGFEEAKAAEENARRNLERQQKLLDRGFVSAQVVDSARAEHAAMSARLQQARKKLDLISEQNRIEAATAESRVATEQAALETAHANTVQIAVSRHEMEAAKAAVEQARAQLDSARSNRTQDRMKRDEIMEARASVTQLENQLREVQVRQRDTTLVATMGGVVTRRYIEAGELVTSGVSSFSSGTPVLQIADLSRMRVRMSVNEVDVQKVKNGLPVEISVDAARGTLFVGHITRVAPAAVGAASAADSGQGAAGQAASGGVVRFNVEVTVDWPDSRLKPGMSAKCAIIVCRRRGVLRILNEGIEGAGPDAKVKLMAKAAAGKAPASFEDRRVRIGLKGDSHTEIVSGLKVGDRVKPQPYSGPKRKEIGLEFN